MSRKNDIESLFSHPNGNEVLLSYDGVFHAGLISSLLSIVGNKLQMTEASLLVRRRVMNVLIESLQNLYHHSEQHGFDNEEEMRKMSGKLLITKVNTVYSVLVGNLISNSTAKQLKERIEYVNSLTEEQLTEEYRNILGNGIRSIKGGGGLGIMIMARKSDESLKYDFVPIDEQSSFFSLSVKIKY